jgi:hypothetical protein
VPKHTKAKEEPPNLHEFKVVMIIYTNKIRSKIVTNTLTLGLLAM